MKGVITIDGPAGSGKSSVASHLASMCGWRHINTGAVYRVAALKIINESISINHLSEVIKSVNEIRNSIFIDENAQIFLNGKNLTDCINTPKFSEAASRIGSIPDVRAILNLIQRELIPTHGVSVVDGRDSGTVVFADAVLKIFLTASSSVRIQRRALELKSKGISFSLDELEKEINERDERDLNRDTAPLKPAPDAVIVDSTNHDFHEVVEIIYNLAHKKGFVKRAHLC